MSCEPYTGSQDFLQKHLTIKAARRAWGWFSFTVIILGAAFIGAEEESTMKFLSPLLDLSGWLLIGLILWLGCIAITFNFFATHIFLNRFRGRWPRLAQTDPIRVYAFIDRLELKRHGALTWKTSCFILGQLIAFVPAALILLALLTCGVNIAFHGLMADNPLVGLALIAVVFILTLLVVGLGHIVAAWLTLGAVAMVSSGDGRLYNSRSPGNEL